MPTGDINATYGKFIFNAFHYFQHIAQGNRVKQSFDIMIPIRSFFSYVKTQVYFTVWETDHKLILFAKDKHSSFSILYFVIWNLEFGIWNFRPGQTHIKFI